MDNDYRCKAIFYVGKGSFANKLIRFWTRSKISHVELYDPVTGYCYTSSLENKGVIKRKRNDLDFYDRHNWIYVDVPIKNYNLVIQFFESNLFKKYDLLTILFNHVIPFKLDSRNKFICSEVVTEALKLDNYTFEKKSHLYTPAELFEELHMILDHRYFFDNIDIEDNNNGSTDN